MNEHTNRQSRKIDVLWISEHALWPLKQGACVTGFNMIRAMHEQGVRVAVASLNPSNEPLHSLLDELSVDWPQASSRQAEQFLKGWSGPAAKLRRRLANYLGLAPAKLAGIIDLVERHQPHTVIGMGLYSPLILRGLRTVRNVSTVWYGADEMLYYHWTCMRHESWRGIRSRFRELLPHAAIETLFVRGLDGAVGVSPMDAKLMKSVAGAKRSVLIRCGNDAEFWTPAAESTRPDRHSVIFWGCMDFDPNVDAVCWFAHHVWPDLKRSFPDAIFRIAGRNPTARVQALRSQTGIEVIGEVADIRPLAHGTAVTVVPMRCGAGSKNKLLEAAGMALPIVVSPWTVRGLDLGDTQPLCICDTSEDWVATIRRLWSDAAMARRMGRNAHAWVRSKHDWSQSARLFTVWLNELPAARARVRNTLMHQSHQNPSLTTQPLTPRKAA